MILIAGCQAKIGNASFPQKIWRVMKLTFALIVVFSLQVHANSSKAQKITIVEKHLHLSEVFKSIENQTAYLFFYNKGLIQKTAPINVNIRNSTLEGALKTCLEGQSLTWSLVGNTVVIRQGLVADAEAMASKTIQPLVLPAPPPVEIHGRVVDNQGNPLANVSVMISGSTVGTTTNEDGRFTITAPDNRNVTLEFSSVGYVAKKEIVGSRTEVNVVLEAVNTGLSEVVVTALGIKRESKSLTYSTQSVNMDQMKEIPDPNIMNSLQGKVSGLAINSSSAGVGSVTRVILRGNRSISGDSQPLYVIDGVPVNGGPQDLSSDNIASINILKGPNAAALYGSAAQNGVIVIETIQGRKGDISIEVNSAYMVNSPYFPLKFQNEYGQGSGGVFNPRTEFSWGPKLDGQMVDSWSLDPEKQGTQVPYTAQPNNISDVFQNGHNSTSNVSIRSGGERIQTAFSYTYKNVDGTIPGNNLRSHNISLRVGNQLTKKLKIDSKLEYVNRTTYNSFQEGAANFNPIMQAYTIPRNIRTVDAVDFEYTDAAGLNKQNFWNPLSTLSASPYWTINRNPDESHKQRTILMTSLTYDLTPDIFLMARGSFDGSSTQEEEKLYNDTYVRAPNGRYTVTKGNARMWNGEVLASYNKEINADWKFNVNLGSSTRVLRSSSVSSNTGLGLLVPNYFAMSNTLDGLTDYNPGLSSNINSVYGFATVNWKNAINLDVTGRNDWSSTLPPDNRSYFYPSAGINVILSDILNMPSAISFMKIRTSWAKVGNSAPPYMLYRTAAFSPGGRNGFVMVNSTIPNSRLVPEETKSIEAGLEMQFLENRIGIDFTYYKTNTSNQLFTIALPIGSGAGQFFTNGGDVRNSGVEIQLTTKPVRSAEFSWDVNVNWSLNRNMVNKISDDRPKVIIGDDPYVREFTIEQGKPYGEIYSRGFLRDDQNRILVADNGMPRVTAGRIVRVANFNPDWMGSIFTSLGYRKISLTALIDHRQGGSIISMTNSMLYANGMTKETLIGRDGGVIFGKDIFSNEVAISQSDGHINNVPISPQTLWNTIGGRNTPVGEAFVESATNTRLREVTLGYTLPVKIRSFNASSLQVMLVGRNLFFIHRASDSIDPDFMVGTTPDSEGFQAFTPPTTRSYGISLKLLF